MIVAFSTSSSVTSVALIGLDGTVLASRAKAAPMAASGAAMELLESICVDTRRVVSEATGFVADLGPGSFTGVRVGVTLAKTLAYALGVEAAGLSSFDLISTVQTVVLPSRKGEFFVKRPGGEPWRTKDLPEGPFTGFGYGQSDVFPSAAAFARHLSRLVWLRPEALVPDYLIEPSISTPKKPYMAATNG